MPPLLLALALGATGAFLLDPQQGRRRRALLRDKVTRTVNEGREFADAAAKDLRYRAQGIADLFNRAVRVVIHLEHDPGC